MYNFLPSATFEAEMVIDEERSRLDRVLPDALAAASFYPGGSETLSAPREAGRLDYDPTRLTLSPRPSSFSQSPSRDLRDCQLD